MGAIRRTPSLRAEEALAVHLEGMAADGDTLPPPTLPVENTEADPDGKLLGKLWITPQASRAARVTITLDETLLARVDQAASARGMTRSGFLAEGARQLIKA
ncbi:MAG: type II toxin-antitoxin system HicB family antitoxin [Aliidongia sp.]